MYHVSTRCTLWTMRWVSSWNFQQKGQSPDVSCSLSDRSEDENTFFFLNSKVLYPSPIEERVDWPFEEAIWEHCPAALQGSAQLSYRCIPQSLYQLYPILLFFFSLTEFGYVMTAFFWNQMSWWPKFSYFHFLLLSFSLVILTCQYDLIWAIVK